MVAPKDQFDQREGERLVSAVLDEKDDPDGADLTRLLKQFWMGFDLSNLEEILSSTNNFVAEDGAYILSELGDIGRPLFARAVVLLSHPHPPVRGFAIDSILAWSDLAEPQAIAQVLNLLADENSVVRQKAINFISRNDPRSLDAAIEFLPAMRRRDLHIEGIALLKRSGWTELETMSRDISSPSEITRGYALACALKLRIVAKVILRRAARSNDDAIRRLAESHLKR